MFFLIELNAVKYLMDIASSFISDFFGGGAVYPGSYCCKNNYQYCMSLANYTPIFYLYLSCSVILIKLNSEYI